MAPVPAPSMHEAEPVATPLHQAVFVTPPPIPLELRAAPARPARGPFWTLDATMSYGGFGALFGPSVRGPGVSAGGSMTFGGGRARHGLRIGGYFSEMEGTRWSGFLGADEPLDARLYGVNVGYLLQVSGFWLSAGFGLFHLDASSGPSPDWDSVTLPEGVLSLGYDIALGRHVALRLGCAFGTLLVSWRAQLDAGVVVRF